MSVGTPIPQYEKAQNIPNGTTYIADMGDGSGTKGIKQEVLSERVGEDLKIGDLENLQTTSKESIVAAINEAVQSGGGGSSVDILDSKEEIEANTAEGKVAGALAVQEMFSEINSNLNGCSFEQEGNDFYIVGADAVRKKLGDSFGCYKYLGYFINGTHTITLDDNSFLFIDSSSVDRDRHQVITEEGSGTLRTYGNQSITYTLSDKTLVLKNTNAGCYILG